MDDIEPRITALEEKIERLASDLSACLEAIKTFAIEHNDGETEHRDWVRVNFERIREWTRQQGDLDESQDRQMMTLRQRIDRLEEREIGPKKPADRRPPEGE